MAQNLKETAVGQIPIDWDAATVADVARITTGSRNTQDKVEDGQFPFFVRSQTVERINSFSFDGEAVLTAGDGVGTGKVFHYINGPFDCHQRVYRISDFTDRMNGFYFFKYFSASFYDRIMSMTAKSSVDSVRREMIADMALPVPPLDEQIAIATALKDIDDLIASLDALIAKKRDIKQAAMQQLLTGKTRLVGFEGEWRPSTIGQEFHVQLGKMLDAEKNAGVLKPYIGNRAVQWDGINVDSLPMMEMSGADFERFRLKMGDILVCEGGEVGRASVWTAPISECYYQKALHRLRPKNGFNGNLFVSILKHWTSTEYLSDFVTQTSIAHLTREKLLTVPLMVPRIEEQAALANVFSAMDAEIGSLISRRTKFRRIRDGMMQQLLTGRIRLV